MKKLPAGMERYIVKKVDKAWRVYDKARGSFPYAGGDSGTVQQDVPEELALAEAARLNGTSPAGSEDPAAESIQLDNPEPEVTVVQEITEEDIPDYGVMTEEERAKYEDGLLENVTY